MSSPIFPIGTRYGTKKTANYRRDADFDLTIEYSIQPDLYVLSQLIGSPLSHLVCLERSHQPCSKSSSQALKRP